MEEWSRQKRQKTSQIAPIAPDTTNEAVEQPRSDSDTNTEQSQRAERALDIVVQVLGPRLLSLEGDSVQRSSRMCALSSLGLVNKALVSTLHAEGGIAMRATFAYERTCMLADGTRQTWAESLRGDPKWLLWGVPRGLIETTQLDEHELAWGVVGDDLRQRYRRSVVPQDASPSEVRQRRFHIGLEIETAAIEDPRGPWGCKWVRTQEPAYLKAHKRVATFLFALRELFCALRERDAERSSGTPPITAQCAVSGCQRIVIGPPGDVAPQAAVHSALRDLFGNLENNSRYWSMLLEDAWRWGKPDDRTPRHRYCSAGCQCLMERRIKSLVPTDELLQNDDERQNTDRIPFALQRALSRNARIKNTLRTLRGGQRAALRSSEWHILTTCLVHVLNVDVSILSAATDLASLSTVQRPFSHLPGGRFCWRSCRVEFVTALARVSRLVRYYSTAKRPIDDLVTSVSQQPRFLTCARLEALRLLEAPRSCRE